MEGYQINHVTFTYPGREKPALSDLCLEIRQGELVTLCGKSGCGKTTLLRLLKPALAPHGRMSGEILFAGRPFAELTFRQRSEQIGFVMQSPDNQIVTDKVWHELAFGLESMGLKTSEIRTRVSEMASFFGIQTWFHKSVAELSGGQKQLLNLASVMAMQPSVLILDEPTSQLDPIAAADFLETVRRINRELGTTVLLSEHRLEEAFPMSDRVLVMEDGKIIADGSPGAVGEALRESGQEMFTALPTPMRIHAQVDNRLACPVTVREGRIWLEAVSAERPLNADRIPADGEPADAETAMELREVWFRYEKDAPDVLKGVSMTVRKGELFALVGGNGTGKSTCLSVIGGLAAPYRGEVLLAGRNINKISVRERSGGLLGVLPQNPQALFVKKTVRLDLQDMLKGRTISAEKKEELFGQVVRLCGLEELLDTHPYDLSGGEQQRAALAKVLLLRPRILLLDEPTKGLDARFKETLAAIFARLKAAGTAIVMVSHDIEFCAKYADRCAMFFDGNITSCEPPRRFFRGNRFYTTSANRMARSVLPEAVLAEDIVLALGGELRDRLDVSTDGELFGDVCAGGESEVKIKPERMKRTLPRMLTGMFLLALFAATMLIFQGKYSDWRDYVVQVLTILELASALACFLPKRERPDPGQERKLCKRSGWTKRTLAALGIVLFVVPMTIWVGVYFLNDRKYYFISLMIILETLTPFCMAFERRRPQARELVIVSVLCAIAVAGRTAFFMLPQFKPVLALVIISGVCFGGETGFLTGAVVGFVSNFFFGQGPLTPWQMFAFGMAGFLAGTLFQKGLLRRAKGPLCAFGGLAALLFYGGIMNAASVIVYQPHPTAQMFAAAYLLGFPLDLIHAFATVFFLWFLSEPMIEKLERIKVKYGLIGQK